MLKVLLGFMPGVLYGAKLANVEVGFATFMLLTICFVVAVGITCIRYLEGNFAWQRRADARSNRRYRKGY